jgi:acetylornithine deacetylase
MSRVPDLVACRDLLAKLVAFDSTSHRSNVPIADFCCDVLDRPGVDVQPLPGTREDKVNVIARMGPRVDDGSGLLLCGHLDVVPADEPGWTSDPFTLVERDGALHGRGACDMKGSVAIMLELARAVDPAGLAAPLFVLLTCDEEVGCQGAHRFVETWPATDGLPRACIVGEPTSLRVVRMHKGHMKLRVTVRGTASHSGYPHLGVNAIEPAARIVTALGALRDELATERLATSEHFPATPFVALNVATIEGGSAVNIIPDRCAIEVGLRPLPGSDTEGLVRRVRERVASITSDGPVEVELLNQSPPHLVDAASPFVRSMLELAGQRDAGAVSYASDAGWLGHLGIESILFGPGTIEVAHRPNECVPIAELARAREIVHGAVARHCRG